MKRTQRVLRGRGEFHRVFAAGQRIDGTLMRCTARIDTSSGAALRVGFAVSSRAYGAVQRNRLRRLMREAFTREERDLLDACSVRGRAIDLVFVFRNGVRDFRRLKVQAMCADMAGICRQLVKLL